MERRKIQRVGASTPTLALPREWIARHGLSRGDEVLLVEDGGRLVLVPAGEDREERRSGEARVVEADLCDEAGLLERTLVAHYVLGRRRIIVRSGGVLTPAHRAEIERVGRRLHGLGVIEESESRVVLQCSLASTDYPLPVLLRRLHELGAGMLRDSVAALLSGDRERAEATIRREDDADTMYWLLLRQASGAPSGASREESSAFRAAARDLEAAADHAEDIARAVLSLLDAGAELDPGLAREIASLAAGAGEAAGQAVAALLGGNLRMANAAVLARRPLLERGDAAIRSIQASRDDPANLVRLVAVVEGILEISFCAKALAASAFNLHADAPAGASHPPA